jgi:serine/threonine protein kinase
MTESNRLDDEALESLVGRVADEFTDRVNRGEAPDVEEYARRYPAIADVLREGLPPLRKLGQSTPRGPAVEPLARNPPLPERLGEYRILREVGRGGMGVVYEALQEPLGRRVALKVLPVRAWTDPSYLERFRREARAAAKLHHTNIVPVFGVGEEQGVCYYAMQFIEGQGLEEVIRHLQGLREEGPAPAASGSLTGTITRSLLTEDEPNSSPAAREIATPRAPDAPRPRRTPAYYRSVARVGLQAAQALAYAHSQGVLHRDVKPANLLLDTHGTVWLTDFGLAKAEGMDDLTHTGDVVGTLRYLAPERLNGVADARSDVYGLGLTLYEMLTLRPAFDDTDRHQLVKQLTEVEPTRPRRRDRRIPRDLETIVVKAMAKEPGRRYASASELAEDLRRFLDGQPVAARPLRPWEQAGRWCRRRPAVAALSGVSLALLLGGLAVVTWQWLRAERNFTAAERQRQRADANYLRACDAVDQMLAEVGARDLMNQPYMTLTRRRLLEKALTFYEGFLRENSGDPNLRQELAKVHLNLGQIHDLLQQREQAEAACRCAVAVFEELAAGSPEIPDHRYELAHGLGRLGNVLDIAGRWEEAEGILRRSLALSQDLVKEWPEEIRYRDLLSRTHNNLAIVLKNSSRRDEELRELRRGVALQEQLTAAFPDRPAYRQNLATQLRNLTNHLWDTGQRAEAMSLLQRSLAIQEKLVARYPEEAHFRWQLATAYETWGERLRATGQVREAEEVYQKCIDLMANLVRDFPEIPPYRGCLATVRVDQGRLLHMTGRQAEAEKVIRAAAADLEQLVGAFPASSIYRDNLADSHRALGVLLEGMPGRRPEAEKPYRAAVALGEGLVADQPASSQYRWSLATSHKYLANLLWLVKRPPEAEKSFRQAIRLLEQLAANAPNESGYRDTLADCRHGLGCVLMELGQANAAEQAYRQALAAREQLARAFPDEPSKLSPLGATLNNLAALLRDQGELPEARRLLEQAVRHQQKALKAYPRHPQYREFLRNHYCGLALTLIRLREHAEAARAARDSAAVRPENGADAYAAASLLARCVRLAAQDAQLPGAKGQQLAQEYADQAMDLLRASVHRGYRNVKQLQEDAALEPLRPRADFRKLLAELDEAAKAAAAK